jgi:hypothetical protein
LTPAPLHFRKGFDSSQKVDYIDYIDYILIEGGETMAEKQVPFVVRGFPASLHKRLKMFAVKEGRTMHWIILTSVEEYLDREENKGGD